MTYKDDPHSKLVAWAKVVLPLLSLALLVTLFLFIGRRDQTFTIPFARVDLETIAREQRLEAPRFATVTEDGGKLSLSSGLVRPDMASPDVVTSQRIDGELALPDGSSIALRAQDLIVDGIASVAELSGDVTLETSSGYVIETQHIASMLNVSRIESPGTVSATGPVGELTSGSMEISRDAETQNFRLMFNDGVKVVYQP